jgi:putative FmdB family regulatory protein
MPTYEYECSSCRHAWDLFQSIKADPERKCPKCGRMTARRKIGIGAAILSGGRSADAQEAPAAGTTGTTPATVGTQAASGDSKPAPSDAKTTPAPTQSSTPTPTPASTPASERGTLNSTHPARDGRGAGNLRDAIRRQRGDPRPTPPASGTRSTSKPAGAAPAKPSAKRATGTRRGGRSR